MKQPTQTSRKKIGRNLSLVAVSFFLTGLGMAFAPKAQSKEIEIEVGIVQRFGEKIVDKLALSGFDDSPLTLNFEPKNGRPQNLQVKSAKLEVEMQPLPTPILEERLVLSDRGTFETAEDSANQWKKLGIEVEITQPERWQVWANREVYQTPALRRWLLESLKSKGHKDSHLETKILREKSRVALLVNGDRYLVDELEITSNSNRIWVSEGETDKNKLLYGGKIKVQPNAYGSYTLVNQVPIETYLRGVVPHEIGPQAPPTAVEAQTIIARTYALRNLRRFKADNYELCANTHCQVYKGLSGVTPRSDRAIAATKDLVLTYDRELVDALYSSTSGGVTAPFSDVWNGAERSYLKAIVDSPNQIWNLSEYSLSDEIAFRRFISLKDGFNETGRSVFRWNRQSSIEQLTQDLQVFLQKTKHPLADLTTIERMEVTERSPSGRVLELEILTDKGIVKLHKNEVRSALGPPRSTLFYLEPVYDADEKLTAYQFIGGGFGHGVGMSQYGSYNLSQLGWSAKQILEFYYPGTKIEPLDDSIVFWREPGSVVEAEQQVTP